MSFFAIAPWEYPGAEFDPIPHATTRLEVGGKKRTFWLKMRGGVIYFREATRVPVFAVPRLFEAELARDPERLVRAWKEEMGRDNYGAFVISHRSWPRTPVAANYCIILRANGSGWIKEHFDETWQKFAIARTYALPLWQSKPAYGEIAAEVVKQTRTYFLERSVDATHFQTIEPHWSNGTPSEMLDVLRSAAQLWLKPEELLPLSKRPIEWNCKSNSAFLAGGVTGDFAWISSYRFNLVWDLAKWHYGFLGVEWQKASDHPEIQAKYKPEVWKRGFGKWGENWRGNWVGGQYKDRLVIPPLTLSSQHDKLEAVLTVREFLRDKMAPEKVEALLNDALKSL